MNKGALPSIKSSILNRQVKRCLDQEGRLDIASLLPMIDSAYTAADQEQYLAQNSLTQMSQELISLNAALQKQADELKDSQTRYTLASQGTNDGLWDWDIITGSCFFSKRWKEILGFEEDSVFANKSDWTSRIHPEHKKSVLDALNRHIAGETDRFEAEYQIKKWDGRYVWVLTRGLAARDDEGRAIRIAGSQTDISQRKRHEDQLYKAAFHDKLTGLPNRALFMDRMRQLMNAFKRGRQKYAGLLFLDLDRFKIINDSLGHEAGDKLLVSVARRLELAVRAADTICRLGGDEFTILLSEIDDENEARSIANRIIDDISKPYFIYGQTLHISGSAGIVVIEEYSDPENAMRNADLAMYQAKRNGKCRAEVFEKNQYDTVYNTLQIENDLRSAINRNEFLPYFQPVINLSNGHVDGLEVLIRWNHPQRGLVQPMSFIPIAEETGLICQMSEILLETVCRNVKLWARSYGYQWSPTVSVNLSVKQLFNQSHLKNLIAIFKNSGLHEGIIKFEVTESVIMEDADQAFEQLSFLKNHGFSLSIDDFGTGYSSLSYIMRYPFDELKIDRAFVDHIDEDPRKRKLVKAVLNLARDLGFKTVGEGTERWQEIDCLRQLGCDFAQGYYFSRPLPALEILDLLCNGLPDHNMVADTSLPVDKFNFSLAAHGENVA